MSTTFHETFKNIKSKQIEVFKLLDTAVRNEEEENIQLAFDNYKKGIIIIDETLAIPISLPENVKSVESEWNEACKIVHKLKKARAETLQRIGVLSRKLNINESQNVSKNLNAISTENETGERPRTYTELAQALRDIQCKECGLNSLELIFQCDGVQLYHIRPDGLVTTSMHGSTMRIIRMEKDDKNNLSATCFIQIIKSSVALRIKSSTSENDLNFHSSNNENVNNLENEYTFASNSNNAPCIDNFDGRDGSSWIYPLVPGVSPCFRTKYGAFIFPDLETSEPGSSFGIIVPKDDKLDEIVLEILEAILHGVVIQGEVEQKPSVIAAQKASENIIKSAEFVSQNLIKGAKITGQFISYATPFLMSKMKPASNDTQPVPQNVQTTVKVAKNVTGVAAETTSYIAEKIGSATMALGRFLAPHVQKHGSTLLSKGFGLDEQEAHEKMSNVLTVAAGAVEGFGTIYSGLEESAKILGKTLGENSTKIIEHKYGSSASNVAAETFDTVGNVINLSQSASYFTPKGFAKKTAKNTGTAIIANYRPTNVTPGQMIPAASLYPNLSLLENEIKK